MSDQPSPAKRPNILLILTDQLRSDAVGFGPRGAFPTPHLDRIAAGSVFTACQSTSPICQPARASLLTGKYPHQIGLRTMSGDLSPQHPTFARALQGAGYHTAAVGKLHYLQPWPWGTPTGGGLNLVERREFFRGYGFDHVWQTAGKQLMKRNYCDWCAYLDERGLLETYREYAEAAGPNHNIADETLDGDGWPLPFAAEHHVDVVTTREACRHLRELPRDKPFFMMASLCSPHKPFDPPQSYLDATPDSWTDDFVVAEGGEPVSPRVQAILQRLRHAYLANVRLVDDLVGELLDTLEACGLSENTCVIFSSDHGEMMGDHGRVQKNTYHHASLTVPTAIRLPGAPAGLVHTSPIELTDLTATMLDLAGLDPQAALSQDWPGGHAQVPARSLVPMLRGEAESVRSCSFGEAGDWECLQSATFKYVRLPSRQPDERRELLFDLVNDPEERRDLASDPAQSERLEWFRQYREWIHDNTPSAQLIHS